MPFVSFIVFLGVGVTLYWSPIVNLSRLFSKSELYSHIPLIPFVSGYFLIMDRKNVFSILEWNCWKGIVLIGIAALIRWLGVACLPDPNPNDCLSLHMLGFVIWIQGSFVFSYGVSALKHALFPLIFLIFLIPIPTFILNPFVQFLQLGSAEAAHMIFKLIGVPLYRDGFVFSLPGFTIEVAEQCSGIRSSLALVITSVLAGYLFLGEGWSRGFLVLSVFPITVFKNALRIVTLSLLAAYVDPRFITGSWLHHSGGILFFAAGLILILPVLWGLRKAEKKPVSSKQ
jgi:exosortase